jgi:IS30 family transposase
MTLATHVDIDNLAIKDTCLNFKIPSYLGKGVMACIFITCVIYSRELKRNRGKKGYRPKQAQIKADGRRQQAPQTLKMTPTLIALIEDMVLLDWSPEQISGTLKEEQCISISHERIYQHIWTDKLNGGTLYKHLRHNGKKRKQYGSKDKRGQIRNRISIDDRPMIVTEKTRIGDWEIDTVIGTCDLQVKNHQGALVTIVDRVSN